MATDSDTAQRQKRARELRAKGMSWPHVVDVLALDSSASPLRLYRLAHNRSAADVVDEINQLDPAATAALRAQRLYDYEMWPEGGRRPSLWVLPILARIYHTSARKLITESTYASYSANDQGELDAADFSHLDEHNPRRAPVRFGYFPEDQSSDPDSVSPWLNATAEADEGPYPAAVTNDESVALFRSVIGLESDPQRQETLLRLALALGGVSGLPIVHKLSPEDRERLADVIITPRRVDLGTVQILKNITEMCRKLDDTRGPETVLRAMLWFRTVVAEILRDTPRLSLWQNLVQVYAELSQFTGWLLYDLGHYKAADRHFKDGLAAAHEAQDIRTAAYIHCCLAHMAAFRRETMSALDHVFAAQGWASRSGSRLLASYTEQLAAWAFADAGWEPPTGKALLRAQKLLPDMVGDNDPSYLYFVDRGFTVGFGAGCWHRLNRSKRALAESEEAIALTDPLLAPRNLGFRLLDRAGALLAQKEIPEAARLSLDIADIVTAHSSVRLTKQLHALRGQLQPWSGTPEMQQLDQRLTELNLSVPPPRLTAL